MIAAFGDRVIHMSICLCCPCSETLRGAMSVSDAAKRDVLDEVEFRQACLRANLKRLRGTCSMYLRDARECASRSEQ